VVRPQTSSSRRISAAGYISSRIEMQSREHGTRAAAAAAAALAGAAGPVSGAASLDGAAVVVSLPRDASSPGLSTPARVVISDLLGAADGAAHGNRIGSRIGVAPFDPTAELAARAAEHAIVLAARDSELATLREQYDHLAVRYQDTRAGPIDVDSLGAPRTCDLPGCERRAWPSHNYCGKHHAIQAGALGASAGTKFPSLRDVWQPPDCCWGGTALPEAPSMATTTRTRWASPRIRELLQEIEVHGKADRHMNIRKRCRVSTCMLQMPTCMLRSQHAILQKSHVNIHGRF
jgi:hypothetical protein